MNELSEEVTTQEPQPVGVDAQSAALQYEDLHAGDPDPSAESGRGGRINRKTVTVGFLLILFVGTVAMAAMAYHFAVGEPARPAYAAAGSTDEEQTGAAGTSRSQAQTDMNSAKTHGDGGYGDSGGDDGSGNSGNGNGGSGNGNGNGNATTADSPSPTPEEEFEVAQQQRMYARALKREDDADKAQDATMVVGDGAIALQHSGATDGHQNDNVGNPPSPPAPTFSPPGDPPPDGVPNDAPSAPSSSGNANSGAARDLVVTTSVPRYYIDVADFIEGTMEPALDEPGVIRIVVRKPVTDSETHMVTLVPMGATITASIAPSHTNADRVYLTQPVLKRARFERDIALDAAAAEPNGTYGISAHVGDYRGRLLAISAIGGALSNMNQFNGGVSLDGTGVTITQPNLIRAALGGLGSGLLQEASNFNSEAANVAPHLTVPEARRITLVVSRRIWLDPFCDPHVPNSLECEVKEYLNEERS